MKRFVVWALAGLLAVVVGVSGCGSDCTGADCRDELELVLPGGITEGAWRFEIDGDREHVTCTFELPQGTGESGCSDGIWLEIDEDRGINLWFENSSWAAEKVRVEAFRDDALTFSADFEPAYEKVAPNGLECGPICNRASIQLDEVTR